MCTCHSFSTHSHSLINLLFCVHLFWHWPLLFFVFFASCFSARNSPVALYQWLEADRQGKDPDTAATGKHHQQFPPFFMTENHTLHCVHACLLFRQSTASLYHVSRVVMMWDCRDDNHQISWFHCTFNAILSSIFSYNYPERNEHDFITISQNNILTDLKLKFVFFFF